jgi:regulator of replication initiation timing
MLLNELLAAGDALLPEERVLVLIHLKDVEQRLILDAEADRLQRAVTAATAQRNDRNSQQLQAALEENRQLQLALDEVRAKLDAITNIERSIRERENGPDTQ